MLHQGAPISGTPYTVEAADPRRLTLQPAGECYSSHECALKVDASGVYVQRGLERRVLFLVVVKKLLKPETLKIIRLIPILVISNNCSVVQMCSQALCME